MKRVFTLSLAILLLISVFSGCKKAFDVDGTIQKLKDKGMVVIESYTTDEAVNSMNALLNGEIKENGGDFTIALKQMTSLIYGDDYSQMCQILVFENTRQAKNMTDFYLSSRGEENFFYVAQSGNVMIATNVDFVQQVIDLKFS